MKDCGPRRKYGEMGHEIWKKGTGAEEPTESDRGRGSYKERGEKEKARNNVQSGSAYRGSRLRDALRRNTLKPGEKMGKDRGIETMEEWRSHGMTSKLKPAGARCLKAA